MASQKQGIITLPSHHAPLAISMLYTLLSRCQHGVLHIKVNQHTYVIQGDQPGPDATIEIIHPMKMLKRIGREGDIGLAEGYLHNDWATDDLTNLLYWGVLNLEHLYEVLQANKVVKWFNRLRHSIRRNSKRGSKRNIAAHYDLGNDFYALWLDSTMTYSSAIFADPTEALESAQHRKYQRLLDSLNASPGQHILEVGCGWGGFAEYAGQRGYHVTGITLSQQQLTWATQRIKDAGLSDRVELRLQDYRDVTEQYDHIVSIEMFEAVGEAYWSDYFTMLYQRLKPGGKAALQVITIDHQHFDQYRNNADFIQLYIFPGGMLPSPEWLSHHVTKADLELLQHNNYAHDYELTLHRWHQQFNNVVHLVEDYGYDQRFIRMWRYYLSYCEAGFRDGRIGLYQYLIAKPS